MELKKSLTTLGVFSLGAGAMISSGIFILPSLAFSEAGVGVLISYFLAGLFMLPAVFTKLELTSAIPRAGGAFFYLTRIFGAPVGMVTGFADWFSIALKSAFALIGIGVFGSLIFPSFGVLEFKLLAVGACLFFIFINLISVEGTGRFQVLMVVFLLAILIGYLLIGYRRMDFSHFQTGLQLQPLQIITTTGMVFISYGGITKIASAVEEIKDPKKMLVPGILWAFIVVQAIYLLAVFVTIGALDSQSLAASYSPLTDAAGTFFMHPVAGGVAVALVAAAGLLAFFTTANAGILAASRVPLAMSRDGMLPQVFGRLTRKGTPYAAILATGAFMIAIIVGLEVKELAKVASLFLLMVFLLENLGLIVIRSSRIANYKPIFKAPFYPFLQIGGSIAYSILIIAQGLVPLLIAGAFAALALLWYLLYAKKGWSKASAFIKMVKKTSGPELERKEADLEDELLSILMERDNIKADRFDTLVRQAATIDYTQTVTRDELFRDTAAIAAKRHNLDGEKLFHKFKDREEQASTLIYPGVAIPHAIPHVVVEGESIFDLILIRNKYGIEWTDKEIVYTAFALIGSRDERNFHLRALMSIAQMLQDPQFNKAWHQAQNEKELKTAVILSQRKRHQEG